MKPNKEVCKECRKRKNWPFDDVLWGFNMMICPATDERINQKSVEKICPYTLEHLVLKGKVNG